MNPRYTLKEETPLTLAFLLFFTGTAHSYLSFCISSFFFFFLSLLPQIFAFYLGFCSYVIFIKSSFLITLSKSIPALYPGFVFLPSTLTFCHYIIYTARHYTLHVSSLRPRGQELHLPCTALFPMDGT